MSSAAAAAIAAVLSITIVVPLGGMIFLHRRGGTWTAFLTGAGTFVVFALVLEPMLHQLVLRSEIGTAIQGNIWLYGLYGGLAAGLFEETGRLLAFQFILKNRTDRISALSYGIGHGGIEAFLLVGLTMAANLALALTYPGMEAPAPEIQAAMDALSAVPAATFLWSGVERLSAMALHLALSVAVFAAVRMKRRRLFPAAVLVHAAVDFAAVTANAFLPVAATEGIVLALTAAAAVWAARIYRNLPKIAENS